MWIPRSNFVNTQYYWSSNINAPLSCTRNDFNYVYHISVFRNYRKCTCIFIFKGYIGATRTEASRRPKLEKTSYDKKECESCFLLTAWINFILNKDDINYKMWNEITYPFPNFNDCTVEIWEWISNFIPHFIIDVITIHAGIKVKPEWIWNSPIVTMIYI